MTIPYDLVCFSHLRWNFVFQRPQHLLSRCAKTHRVYFIEEPIDANFESLDVSTTDGVTVVTPRLQMSAPETEREATIRRLLDKYMQEQNMRRKINWYITPLAIAWLTNTNPDAIVYDCMDELSAFKGAHPLLLEREKTLFAMADLVFTGGQSLYEAKKHQHKNVFAFPSSVDVPHFKKARTFNVAEEPMDQREIPHPRFGFFGVLDERFDIELLRAIALQKPTWQFIMIGPVIKIHSSELPHLPNIHYLGSKQYNDLPSYIAGWDAALLLFARNPSTEFISPTKTPEYLAAGKSVVSTSIKDVVRPYGQQQLVRIADDPNDFVMACEDALREKGTERPEVDQFLSKLSWERTWSQMEELIQGTLSVKRSETALSTNVGA